MKILAVVLVCMLSQASQASPLTLAGFTFAEGEEAFADDASLVSGSIRLCGGSVSIQVVMAGSDVLDCINSAVSEGGFVDVFFTDNSIVNEPGNDLVVFERSGPLGAGTPDPREVFGLSVFDGAVFTSFLQLVPVDTGFRTFEDGNPTGIFAAAIDLGSFGIAPGATIDLVRLHIFNANLGTKSADVTAIGALHSGAAVPQPSTANLLAVGLLVLARIAQKRRQRTGRPCLET